MNVKVELEASEERLAARRTANGNRLGLDFSTCTFAFPELDWVQQFLHYIKIKEIVSSPEKAHALRNVLPLLSPRFLRVLSFTTALSQEAATRFSAPLAGQRQVPRASPFPVAHSGTQAAFSPRPPRRQKPCPRPPRRPSPGRGGAALARRLPSPAEATPGVRRPRYSYLVPELTGHPALHGARGAGAARVRALRGAAAPARPRPGAVGGAPVALTRRRLQHPRPSSSSTAAPLPPCFSGTSRRAAVTSLRPQGLVV